MPETMLVFNWLTLPIHVREFLSSFWEDNPLFGNGVYLPYTVCAAWDDEEEPSEDHQAADAHFVSLLPYPFDDEYEGPTVLISVCW